MSDFGNISDFVNMTDMNNVNLMVNIDILSSITFALVILLAGFTVGKLVGIAVFKVLRGMNFDKTLKMLSVHKLVLSRNISIFISWGIYVVAVILALLSLDIFYWTLLVLVYFIGIIFVGTIVLGLVFAIPNLISGFKLRHYALKGKFIVLSNVSGEVVKMGLFNVHLIRSDNKLFVVPNRSVKNFQVKDK